MNDIEKYAVTLVGAGALSYAEDDTDEDGEFVDREDWCRARVLGLDMSVTVKDNPESFLAWYRSVAEVDS